MIKWNYWKWYDVVMSCLGCLGTKCLTIILWNNKSTVKPRLIFIWDQFYPPMYAECQILGQLWWLITLYIFCHFRWERKKNFFTKSALKWILTSAKVFFLHHTHMKRRHSSSNWIFSCGVWLATRACQLQIIPSIQLACEHIKSGFLN